MVSTSLGSQWRPLFYFLCYIHFSLSVEICKICLKSPCTASTALLAPIEVQGLLRQIWMLCLVNSVFVN